MSSASSPIETNTTVESTGFLPAGQSAADVTPPMTRDRVLGMALPILGESILQTLVGVADTLMVARVGKASIAGVGTAVEFVFFIISILIAMEIGATVLISQSFGAQNLNRANHLARQAIVWGLLVAMPVSILGYFGAGWVIGLFGTEADVAREATKYLSIIAATSVALLMSLVCAAIFRGIGDSRTPLYASSVANVINVLVAYLLVFGKFGLPEMGVAGAAIGAAIGRTVGASIMLTILFFGHRLVNLRGWVDWRPEISTGRELFKLGLPASLEQILTSAGFISMMAIVAMLGTASLAAQQVGFTAMALSFMPAFAFAVATTALVGQSVGARVIENARSATRIALGYSVAWMTVGGLITFFFAEEMMRLFTHDQEVVDAGIGALRALAFALPFWALWSVTGGALRGLGDTRTPLISSAGSTWLAVLFAFIMVKYFNGNLAAVWGAFVLTSPIGASINWWVLRERFVQAEAQMAKATPTGESEISSLAAGAVT